MHIRNEAHKKNLKYRFIADAISTIGMEIVTTQEITKAVRDLAILNWGDVAKSELKNIGIVTDKDIYDHMSEKYTEWEIQDPENQQEFYDLGLN